jgi:hypothetical protein
MSFRVKMEVEWYLHPLEAHRKEKFKSNNFWRRKWKKRKA